MLLSLKKTTITTKKKTIAKKKAKQKQKKTKQKTTTTTKQTTTKQTKIATTYNSSCLDRRWRCYQAIALNDQQVKPTSLALMSPQLNDAIQ